MKKNKLARAFYESNKNQSKIKAHIRLKKNGRFSSVSGVVYAMRVNMDGRPYAVIKGGKHDYQSVPLENVIIVVKDGGVVVRK